MADFDAAFLVTIGHEGGYANDRLDRGGETYRGVARNSHPGWLGWGLVDAAREDDDFPACLGSSVCLQREVRNFYRHEYWDRMRGDAIDSQSIANEVFDTAVNMGRSRAVRFLQRACNALNRNGDLYPDLTADGVTGPLTLRSVDALLRVGDAEFLLLALNILQGAFYMEIMSRDPTQERFARGWLKRARVFPQPVT